MNKIPKVFVGTMYCNEGDFDAATNAILKQRNVEVVHTIITDLPEKQAHNSLWQSWRLAKQNGCNMFIKIDADTVLAHENVIFDFWDIMCKYPRVTGIQAPLLDYFTDDFINGLNCFSTKVIFNDTTNELFCDRQVDVGHDIVLKANSVPESLRPAGYHCYYTTDEQAFHFGLHRALKGQQQIIEQVKVARKRYDDRYRTLALLGSQVSSQFRDGGFNYADEKFKLVLENVLKNYNELRVTL